VIICGNRQSAFDAKRSAATRSASSGNEARARGEGRLLFLVIERGLGARTVERVSPDEDDVRHLVGVAVIEDRLRAAEVDLVSLLGGRRDVRDGRHVHHDVRSYLAEDVLGGALADVDGVHLDRAFADRRRRVGPVAAIDADHPMPLRREPHREEAGELSGDAGDEDLHAAAPREIPSWINPWMRSFTWST
jgi:hypothetical protein